MAPQISNLLEQFYNWLHNTNGGSAWGVFKQGQNTIQTHLQSKLCAIKTSQRCLQIKQSWGRFGITASTSGLDSNWSSHPSTPSTTPSYGKSNYFRTTMLTSGGHRMCRPFESWEIPSSPCMTGPWTWLTWLQMMMRLTLATKETTLELQNNYTNIYMANFWIVHP